MEASKPSLDAKILKITDFKKTWTVIILTMKGIHFSQSGGIYPQNITKNAKNRPTPRAGGALGLP